MTTEVFEERSPVMEIVTITASGEIKINPEAEREDLEAAIYMLGKQVISIGIKDMAIYSNDYVKTSVQSDFKA
jgi:hypothetical protein